MKKKKLKPRWSWNEIKSALSRVQIEVRSPYNPLPMQKSLLDVDGIGEFLFALHQLKKKRGKK